MMVMDDGHLAEASFALNATEIRSGVPTQVSLRWQGTNLEYHELDFEKYYVRVPSDANELEVRFDTRSATSGAEGGLWIADKDVWPGLVRSSKTADRVLRKGVARIRVRRPGNRWPAAYFILTRAAESNSAQVQTLDGTLVATTRRFGNGNQLIGGQQLQPGEFIQARSSACRLEFQTDGNLVAYHNGVAYWNAGTRGADGGSAAMQIDGNLVVYDATGAARWSTLTGGNNGAHIGIQDDCNVVLRSAGGAALWSSGRP
ncbi:MAG: hypothetical protein OXG72_00960 [Acidobacteria bacterium]|nr:hypothetical protein [Acidobacteriota bacterium]